MAGFRSNKVVVQQDGVDVPAALAALARAVSAQGDELSKLNGGVTLGGNTPGSILKLSFQMPPDAPFIPLTLTANLLGFSANRTPSYLMMPGGRVAIRGAIDNDKSVYLAGIPAGTLLSTLPVGYRPAGVFLEALQAYTTAYAATPGGVIVDSSAGGIRLVGYAVAIAAVDLSGMIEFFALNAAPPHQFTGANWPLKVRHDFPRCRGLVVLSCRLQGQAGGVGVGTPQVDWQDVGDGTLRVNGVWGLQWGSRYEMLIYVTPEEES